jgi:hypothetical protein
MTRKDGLWFHLGRFSTTANQMVGTLLCDGCKRSEFRSRRSAPEQVLVAHGFLFKSGSTLLARPSSTGRFGCADSRAHRQIGHTHLPESNDAGRPRPAQLATSTS